MSYERLLEAIKANNGEVPRQSDDPDRPELLQSAANWAKEQRKQYKSKTLIPLRCQLLEQIPGWRWKETREESWRANFAEWQHYYAEHGKDPPRIGPDAPLGHWITHVREASKSKASSGRKPLEKWQLTLLKSDPNWK